MNVVVNAESLGLVEAFRIRWRMLGEIEFGRVLCNENDRVLDDASTCGVSMRRENLAGRDVGIIEEAISGERVTPAIHSGVDTGLRLRRECSDDLNAAIIPAFVPQIDPREFVRDVVTHQ